MQHERMEKMAVRAGVDPHLLLRRLRGEKVYPHLQAALQVVPSGEMLVLAFSEDQDSDPSFMDETLVKLGEELLAGKYGERGIVLMGLNESTLDSLRGALAIRRDDAPKQGKDFNLAFLLFNQAPPPERLPVDGWAVVGSLERSLMDVLQLLAQRLSLSAADVAHEFDLTISTASMRLKRLHERHLIHRKYQTLPNGREFVYVFWV